MYTVDCSDLPEEVTDFAFDQFQDVGWSVVDECTLDYDR
jgi:hypothetical protein